jgi:hypothetical protein
MYGQALGWMEWKVWIPSLFSASVPRSLCGFVPSFLTNLKISSPFFLDLTCAIIQRCLFSGRGERADFCDSSSSYYLLLLLLFLIFNIIFFFSLTLLLGLPSVCLSRLLLLPTPPSRKERERERSISTDSVLRSWNQDGKRRCGSFACTRVTELMYVGYGWGRFGYCGCGYYFIGIHLYFTLLYFTLLDS